MLVYQRVDFMGIPFLAFLNKNQVIQTYESAFETSWDPNHLGP